LPACQGRFDGDRREEGLGMHLDVRGRGAAAIENAAGQGDPRLYAQSQVGEASGTERGVTPVRHAVAGNGRYAYRAGSVRRLEVRGLVEASCRIDAQALKLHGGVVGRPTEIDG